MDKKEVQHTVKYSWSIIISDSLLRIWTICYRYRNARKWTINHSHEILFTLMACTLITELIFVLVWWYFLPFAFHSEQMTTINTKFRQMKIMLIATAICSLQLESAWILHFAYCVLIWILWFWWKLIDDWTQVRQLNDMTSIFKCTVLATACYLWTARVAQMARFGQWCSLFKITNLRMV